ncbi:MAG: radical SAM family heme chaperone HemW [Clostridia bacterium]|nr:radical SAM family heme chaperone HemW [Clostridia bacterium]
MQIIPKPPRPIGLYVHVPFCVHKCAYCDFYSVTDLNLMREYTSAVVAHIRSKKKFLKNTVVETIYFGGGTPSLLPVAQLERILNAIYSTANVAPDAEITLEANPGTLTSKNLSAYKKMGINRLSIGLQSADDEELSAISRIHTRAEFENSFMLARMEGFNNINVDLIYALPKQTKTKLFGNIDYVISMNPEHISLYGLTIEPETPFGKNKEILSTIPDEDEQYEMYMSACKRLEECGYFQYEISNFAKKDRGCKHNMKYWMNKEYISFGPAAASFVENTEYTYARDIELYLSNLKNEKALRVVDEDTGETEHVLDDEELETRFVMLHFRLRAGINTGEYRQKFGLSFEKIYEDKLEKYMKDKYIVRTEHGFRLTRRGMLISNTILSDILEF